MPILSILDYTSKGTLLSTKIFLLDLIFADIYNKYRKDVRLIMNIAIITGASSGMGVNFAEWTDKLRDDIDEIWLIARREEKLKSVAEKLNKKVKIIPLDITLKESHIAYAELLKNEKANVRLLINNAGYGKLGDFDKLSNDDNAGMIRLNCEALTVMSSLTLPFMTKGAEIINSCSIASFAPNTRMAVYSSTKAYVMSLSRAMREELKKSEINVLAVCPGPMDTEFLSVAGIDKGKSRTFDTLPRVNPSVIAKKSIIASSRKKAVYTNRLFYKFYRLLAKLLPVSLVMKLCGT